MEGWCPLLWKSWICPWMCTATHWPLLPDWGRWWWWSGLTRRVGGNNVRTVHNFVRSAYSYSNWFTIMSAICRLQLNMYHLPIGRNSWGGWWWSLIFPPGDGVVTRSGGSKRGPLQTKIFSISCSFSENLVKIICWCPPLEGWHPLLQKSWICPWTYGQK